MRFVPEAKERLRLNYRKIRDRMPAAERRRAALAVARGVLALPRALSASTVGIYLGKGAELATGPLLRRLLALRKAVAAPCADPARKRLEFRLIRGVRDCRKGAYGILEPKPGCPPVPRGRMGLVLVPGIVFDKRGYRVGYGQGYYDRFLAGRGRPYAVGLCYDAALVPRLPREAFDVPVAAVVTEKRVHLI